MSEIPEHCSDGAARLSDDAVAAMASAIDSSWDVKGGAEIERRLAVRDFQAALDLVNAIGAVAEAENHHPDLAITGYRNVTIALSTHDAGGLTGNDFSLARRIDALIAG